jgi:hopanoid C-3 methylase HpnR
MKVLFTHPSSLMYSEVYLRLEPLGLELVAQAASNAGQSVRVLDLQIFSHRDYFRMLDEWQPEAVGFSLNYLANIPEVLDLAAETRRRLPGCFIFAGGHSASFTAREILRHGAGWIDCVVRGEGEAVTPRLLDMVAADRDSLHQLPGIVTLRGEGPPAALIPDLDAYHPARDRMAKRNKYFIGALDPAASIEFTRGCPWDCSFCSAWTFYGRHYRRRNPEAVARELASIREPGVFIVDDVAFIQLEHGMAIADEIERRGIRKQYYLETRGDVLLRNQEVFRRWKRLGLEYMFLGLEAIDEEGLKRHRKRTTVGKNFEALEFARSLDLIAAINIIVDPSWDENRFAAVREWALSVPEIVHLTVNTPYPGTETWLTESRNFTTRDYRLFDVQHAVLPTALPLDRFYRELVRTQEILNGKYMGWSAIRNAFTTAAGLLLHGQTNFVEMLWKFHAVYNPDRQFADHQRPVRYEIELPRRQAGPNAKIDPASLYIHPAPALSPALSPARTHASPPLR